MIEEFPRLVWCLFPLWNPVILPASKNNMLPAKCHLEIQFTLLPLPAVGCLIAHLLVLSAVRLPGEPLSGGTSLCNWTDVLSFRASASVSVTCELGSAKRSPTSASQNQISLRPSLCKIFLLIEVFWFVMILYWCSHMAQPKMYKW